MEHLQLSASEFANEIGISKAMLSSIKTDRTKPSLQLVEKIKAKYTNVSLNWIILGKGDMFEKGGRYIEQEIFADEEFFPTNNVENSRIELSPTSERKEIEKEIEIHTRKAQPEKNTEPIAANKTTTKVIIFYSDNTFEEFLR